MGDLTIVYYTANRIDEGFAKRVREELLKAIPPDTPIVSVSHKPVDLGENICVGNIPYSTYSCYQQILIGTVEAKTKYVACAEDDVLYTREHFEQRPSDDETFAYNRNRWWLEERGIFRWRNRTANMCACIAPRDLMIKTLKRRFEMFPFHPQTRAELTGWGEMGRYEKVLGLPQVKMELFSTREPIVTFNQKPSLGGLRKQNPTDITRESLYPWGDAKELWSRIRGFNDRNPQQERDVPLADDRVRAVGE